MGEGSRASRRDEAFSLGVENSLPFLSQGASSSHVPQGFGYQQPPYWVSPSAPPPSYFPQFGASYGPSFSMGSGYYGSGFSYNSVSIPYSTSNTNRYLGFQNIAPPNSNSFPRFPMTDNFYYSSGLPCNSMGLPTTSPYALLPPSGSSSRFIENDHSNFAEIRNQEGHVRDMGTQSIPSRGNNTMGMLQMPRQPFVHPSAEEFNDDLDDSDLKLLIKKELSNSDVGAVGRIVLPKKDAEANLPRLIEKDGIMLEMFDPVLVVTWRFKYRFWPNNKSRMYVIESTGEFVKAHGLQAGDYFVIYRSLTTDNYVVKGEKGVQPPHVDGLHCGCEGCGMNVDCSLQQPMDEREGSGSRQLWLENGTSLGQASCSSAHDNLMHTYCADVLNIPRRWNTGLHRFSQPGTPYDNQT